MGSGLVVVVVSVNSMMLSWNDFFCSVQYQFFIFQDGDDSGLIGSKVIFDVFVQVQVFQFVFV